MTALPGRRRGPIADRDLASLAAFIEDDPLVMSHYLLYAEASQREIEVGSLESYILFFLWFLVHGRAGHVPPLVIPDGARAYVTTPRDGGPHLLMRYAAEQMSVAPAGERLRSWYLRDAIGPLRLGPFLAPAELATAQMHRPAGPVRPAERRPAVSVIGFHRSVLGIGEDARALFHCLVEAGHPVELVDVSPPGLEPFDDLPRYAAFEASRPNASIAIFCLPFFEMTRAIARFGLDRPQTPQYRIGFWPWETSALPPGWDGVYAVVDEVWASSGFLRDVYAAGTRKPVVQVAPLVEVAPPGAVPDLGLRFEGLFTAVSVFDFNARIERKNPLGAIDAFRLAFPRGDEPAQLVLKTLHGHSRPQDLERLRGHIGRDARIVVVDGPLPREALCGLIARADAYLSLHRSEGFGRPLAEAMLLGTPVVATGWSGCADFLDEETGFPVRSRLRPVRREEYPFAAGEWAEPDPVHAAERLAEVFAGSAAVARKVEAAAARIGRDFGLAAAAARVGHRLHAIASGRGAPDDLPRPTRDADPGHPNS